MTKGFNANNLTKIITRQQDLKEKSSSNNDKHEEVFNLSWMNIRSQTQVNQHYTQEEVELESQLAEI
jgi:hypothetical protein